MRLIVVVSLRVPEVPVIVTVALPVAAVVLAVRVRVLVEAVGFGVKTAVTPLGKLEARRPTVLSKPLRGVIVIVLVPWLP